VWEEKKVKACAWTRLYTPRVEDDGKKRVCCDITFFFWLVRAMAGSTWHTPPLCQSTCHVPPRCGMYIVCKYVHVGKRDVCGRDSRISEYRSSRSGSFSMALSLSLLTAAASCAVPLAQLATQTRTEMNWPNSSTASFLSWSILRKRRGRSSDPRPRRAKGTRTGCTEWASSLSSLLPLFASASSLSSSPSSLKLVFSPSFTFFCFVPVVPLSLSLFLFRQTHTHTHTLGTRHPLSFITTTTSP